MGLLFGVGSIILKMTKRKENHSAYSSFNFSIKETYLQTGKRGTNMVKEEQMLKTGEETEYLGTLNEPNFGKRPNIHIPDYEGN